MAHRAAVVSEKRLRRGDMARARNLLLALEEESLGILGVVHGEEWHPHRWIHLIFPTGEMSASDPGLGITHRSVQAFLNANSFAWREVLERVVGKSEASPWWPSRAFSTYHAGSYRLLRGPLRAGGHGGSRAQGQAA